jgi:hypothetical protein
MPYLGLHVVYHSYLGLPVIWYIYIYIYTSDSL